MSGRSEGTTTHRERMFEVLKSGEAICIACLSRMLNLWHKAVHQMSLKIEDQPGYSRTYGTCVACRQVRIVLARC